MPSSTLPPSSRSAWKQPLNTGRACVAAASNFDPAARSRISSARRALEPVPVVRVSRGPLVIYCHPIRLLPGAFPKEGLRLGRGSDKPKEGNGEKRFRSEESRKASRPAFRWCKIKSDPGPDKASSNPQPRIQAFHGPTRRKERLFLLHTLYARSYYIFWFIVFYRCLVNRVVQEMGDPGSRISIEVDDGILTLKVGGIGLGFFKRYAPILGRFISLDPLTFNEISKGLIYLIYFLKFLCST